MQRRLGLACGLLAPLVLNLSVAIEGHFRPGYDPTSQFISELSLGPRGFVQHLTFFLTGTLMVIFGWTLRITAPRRGAHALLAVGLGLLVAGFFDTDPFPMTALSLTGAIHDLAASVVFPSMIAVCFVFGRHFLQAPESRRFGQFTLGCGAVTAFFYALVVIGFPYFKPAPEVLLAHIGLLQRLAQGAFFLWCFGFALRSLLQERTNGR